MAKDTYYFRRKFQARWGIETARRNTGAGKDTTNAAGVTTYHFPILVGQKNSPVPETFVWNVTTLSYQRVTSQKFFDFLQLGSVSHGMIEFKGPVLDFTMMKFLFKYAVNAGAGDPYTHTFDTSDASYEQEGNGAGETVPTIFMIFDLSNDDPNESIYPLMLGCVVSYYHMGSREIGTNTPIEGTIRIKVSKVIDGTNLTAWGTYPTLRPHYLDSTIQTLTKADAAIPGYGDGFDWWWDDHTVQLKWANHQYSEHDVNGSPEMRLTVYWAIQDRTLFDDYFKTPLDPATASDLAASVKMYINETTKYILHELDKMWPVNDQSGIEYKEVGEGVQIMIMKLTFIFKPTHYESGGYYKLEEKNAYPATRYT
jgi:hypothetical protein